MKTFYNFLNTTTVLMTLIIFISLSPSSADAGFASTGGKRKALVKCEYKFGVSHLFLTLYSDGGYHNIIRNNVDGMSEAIGNFFTRAEKNSLMFYRYSNNDTFKLTLFDRDMNNVLHGTLLDTKLPNPLENNLLSITCQLADDFDDYIDSLLIQP